MKLILALALALSAAAECTTLSAPSMGMHAPKEDAQVTHFLASIDLAEYAAAFAEHKVDYETLTKLNDADLKEMGIKALGARKRIAAKQRSLASAKNDQAPRGTACPGPPSVNTTFALPMAPSLIHDSTEGADTSSAQISTQCQFVDLNGDGLPDYVCSGSGANNWPEVREPNLFGYPLSCVYMNNGNGWSAPV
jgi:hypothetical protein